MTICSECGTTFDHADATIEKPTHVVPSIWPEVRPSAHLCSTGCYDRWIERQNLRGQSGPPKLSIVRSE